MGETPGFLLFFFLAALGLCWCTLAFSSLREQGLLSGEGSSHSDGFCCY